MKNDPRARSGLTEPAQSTSHKVLQVKGKQKTQVKASWKLTKAYKHTKPLCFMTKLYNRKKYFKNE